MLRGLDEQKYQYYLDVLLINNNRYSNSLNINVKNKKSDICLAFCFKE